MKFKPLVTADAPDPSRRSARRRVEAETRIYSHRGRAWRLNSTGHPRAPIFAGMLARRITPARTGTWHIFAGAIMIFMSRSRPHLRAAQAARSGRAKFAIRQASSRVSVIQFIVETVIASSNDPSV